jgi:nucleoside-diphosphate-sugar epimerase
MKVAILGAGGYLGSYLVKHLSPIYTVLPISRDTIDLTNFGQVKAWLIEHRPDVVIHCAVTGGKQNVNEKIYEDVQSNLNIFLNFYNNSQYFKQFINVGSGSEFDSKQSIDTALEEHVLDSFPVESYAYSKNLIARLVLEKHNFFTLRLFGCFDQSEPDFRLLKKFTNTSNFSFYDRKFDYISASDFCKIVKHYIDNDMSIKDMNCVYSEKFYLSEILTKFKTLHHIPTELKIEGINILNYTGSSAKLDSLDLQLDGLDKGLEHYFKG